MSRTRRHGGLGPGLVEGLPRLDGIKVLMVDDQEEAQILGAQTLSETSSRFRQLP